VSSLPKPGAVLFAKDLTRMAQFYSSVAGLAVVLSESKLIVLESPLMQLVLHGMPKRIAESISITTPPALRENAAAKLVFPVASLAAARVSASAVGGGLLPPKKEFASRGFRACDGNDPEGNVVQFRQHVV